MKFAKTIFPAIVVLLICSFPHQTFSQSDYEIVQEFKQKYKQIEESINSANNMGELNAVVAKIDNFRKDYVDKKNLLDKSLYPDNFDRVFEKLDMAFVIRNQDFTTIDVLQTENIELKEQITILNQRNTELINKIQEYEYVNKKNAKKIAELENLVASLRTSLKRRDELILSIVDSLMPTLTPERTALTPEEQNQVYIEAEKGNVLANIKKSLMDNIKFIEVTALEPNDLSEIKKQQRDFSNFWQYEGVKLVDVYTVKKQKSNEIRQIDSLFTFWYWTLDYEAWINIKAEFAFNDILLLEFTNGDEFTNVVTSYIDEEIKNIGVKSIEQSEYNYAWFADSTWFKVIGRRWVPYLIENEMLSIDNKDKIESKISDWKGRLTPSSFDWIYIIVALMAVGGVAIMYKKRRSRLQAE
jgi:nucleoid DNA-binding protein